MEVVVDVLVVMCFGIYDEEGYVLLLVWIFMGYINCGFEILMNDGFGNFVKENGMV